MPGNKEGLFYLLAQSAVKYKITPAYPHGILSGQNTSTNIGRILEKNFIGHLLQMGY